MRAGITAVLVFISVFGNAFGTNPIVTAIYTADPAAMVYNDTVYLYTGHDEAPNGHNGYVMNDWQLFTSTDMVNWTSHGAVLNVSAFSWSKGDAWAAEVEERNGKFYYYVCTEHKSIPGKALGVAVADSPEGPFVDARGSALVTNDMTTQVNISWDDIDPTVFIDDGQAYIYWGNSACYYAKLKDNMIELDGGINFVNLPSYTEAPFLHKKDDLYYLTYAYGWEEQIAYATAPAVTGPWTFRGVINDHVNNCNTNHQSVIEYKNQWYFVYHTGDIGGSYQRSVAVDYLFYNEDGTIREIVQTREGVQSTVQTENCLPMPVDLSYKINGSSPVSGKSALIMEGDSIAIRSEIADSGGAWEWTGPNGYTSALDELSFENASVDLSGKYKTVHTRFCGTKSTGIFDLSVSPINNGKTYVIKPYNSNLRVGLEGGGGENGTNVNVSAAVDEDYQRFFFTNPEGKYYRITPVSAQAKALDVSDVSTADGANIIIWDYWGGHGQQYELRPSGNETYNIVACHSGKCLDWNIGTNNLIQWSCHGGDNQKFEIIEWEAGTEPEFAVLVNSDRIWSVIRGEKTSGDWDWISTYYIRFSGDTTINNYAFKGVIESYDPTASSWSSTGKFIRQKSGRVYLRNESGEEVLLYDFNLKAGDTVSLQDISGEAIDWKAESVDSVSLNDGIHRRINLTIAGCEDCIQDQWIEGIGSTSGVITPAYLLLDQLSTELLCVRESNQTVYRNPEFNGCYISVGIEERQHDFEVRIYPNPADDFIRIETKEKNCDYTICNPDGRIMMTGRLIDADEINVAGLSPGIYILKISSTNCSESILIRKN